jgi:hypothetical protein
LTSVRCIFAVLATCFASLACAQEGPSYEETVDFILEKSRVVDGSYSGGQTGHYSLELPDRCILVSEQIDRDGSNVTNYRQSRVNLSDIDPSTVDTLTRTAFPAVRLWTRDQDELITERVPDQTGSIITRRTYIAFVAVRDPDRNLDRVVRAFRHLVSLCGGREELF